ncbi:hypothetical protein ACK3TF_000469 [Chlorella vulgaris]
MKLHVRTVGGGPVPLVVQAKGELSVKALLDQLVPEAAGAEHPRLVYHGRVLREGSKLRDALADGDVVVLLPGRRVQLPRPPASPQSKGPSLREINAAIREDLARQGPGRLAAAEAAAQRQAREPRPQQQQQPTDVLTEALMTGELGALRAYLEQLQESLRGPGGGGAAPAADGAAAARANLALEDLFGQVAVAAMQAGGGAGGGAAAGGLLGDEDEEDEEEEEEEDDELLTDEEGEEEEEEEEEDEGELFDSEEEGSQYTEGELEEEEGGEGAGELLPPQVPELDSTHLAALMEMGFGEGLCRNALLMGRNRFDPALDWLLGHAEDPAAAEPLSDAQLARLYGRAPARLGPAEQALRTFNNSLPAAAAWLLTAGFIGGEEDVPAAGPPPAEQAPEAAGAAAADEARSGRPASIGSSRGDEPQTQEEPSAAGWAPQVGQPPSASGSDSEGDDPALLQRGSGGSSVDDRDGGHPPAGQQQEHSEEQAGRPGPLLESEAEEEEGGEEAPPLLAADDDTAA